MTAGLVNVLERTPFTLGDPKTGASIYEPIVLLLERLGDRRCVPALEALLEQPTTKSVNLRKYFADRLPQTIASIRGPRAPLDAAIDARIDAIMTSRHRTGSAANGSRPARKAAKTPLTSDLL